MPAGRGWAASKGGAAGIYRCCPRLGRHGGRAQQGGKAGRGSFLNIQTNTFINSHTRGCSHLYALTPLLQTQQDFEESTFQTQKNQNVSISLLQRSNLVVLMIWFNFPDQTARSETQTNPYFHSLKPQPSCQFVVNVASWRCCRANGSLPHKFCIQGITLITPRIGFTGIQNLLQERLL